MAEYDQKYDPPPKRGVNTSILDGTMEEEQNEIMEEVQEMTQDELDQAEAERDEAMWAEKCELNQGAEFNEEDFEDFEDYESISDGDEEYELERALIQEEEN